MESSISNKKIVHCFAKSANHDVKQNFIGVFPSNFLYRFNSFHDRISESDAKYPFVITNTDRSVKKGTQGWSFFNLHPKKKPLCLTVFVLKVLRNLLSKMTKRSSVRYFMVLKSLIKKGNKITLVTLRFSIEYKKLKTFDKLSKTTVDLLHLINKYGKKHRLRNEAMVNLVDDQLHMIEKYMCAMRQIYFYVNLFNSLDNSSLLREKKLNKRTIGNCSMRYCQ